MTSLYGTSSTSWGAAFGVILIVSLVIYQIAAFILGMVFKKAKRPQWAAFVPIYNSWVIFEISGKPGWWSLFGLIPYVGTFVVFILYIFAALELAKRFGKSPVFAVFGLIIFSVVGYIMLAFGKAEYNAPGVASGSGNSAAPPTVPAGSSTSTTPPASSGPTVG